MESRDLGSLLGQGSNHGKGPFLTIIVIIIIIMCVRERGGSEGERAHTGSVWMCDHLSLYLG